MSIQLCQIDQCVLDHDTQARQPKALSAAMKRKYRKLGVVPSAAPKPPARMRPRQFERVLRRAQWRQRHQEVRS